MMIRPSKKDAQEKLMTDEHKAMRKDLEAHRNEDGHATRVDSFNARLVADLGAENVTFLLRSYE